MPNKAFNWRWGFCGALRVKQFSAPYHFSGWTASLSLPQRK